MAAILAAILEKKKPVHEDICQVGFVLWKQNCFKVCEMASSKFFIVPQFHFIETYAMQILFTCAFTICLGPSSYVSAPTARVLSLSLK